MNITLSSNDQNTIKEILEILKPYSLNSLKLQIELSPLEKDRYKHLCEKLTKPNVDITSHNEHSEDSSDNSDSELDVNSSIIGNSTISIGKENDHNLLWELKDKYLYYLFKGSQAECNMLHDWAKKNEVLIEPGNETINFEGPKTAIEYLKQIINNYFYEKIALNEEEAWALRHTNQIRKLIEPPLTIIRIIPEQSNQKRCLVIYGKNKEKVEKGIKVIKECAAKLIKLFEISEKYRRSNEIEEILEYLNKTYSEKCKKIFEKISSQNYQFIKSKNTKSSRYNFYLFLDCQKKQFDKVKDYIQKDVESLCLLNVIGNNPHSRISEFLSPKIIQKSLKDKSSLLIGKAKYFNEIEFNKLENPRGLLSGIKKCRLRLPKGGNFFCNKVIGESLIRDKMMSVEEKFDPSMFIFVIDSQFQIINKIFQNFLNLNDSEEHKEETQVLANLEKENKLGNNNDHYCVLSNDSDNQSNTVQYISSFSQENIYKIQFNSEEHQPINNLSSEDFQYKKIEKLLQKGFPQISILQIYKVYDDSKWTNYQNSRKNCESRNDVKEYILFLETTEEPQKILSPEMDISTLKNSFIDSFNPDINQCHKDKENKFIIFVFSILVDEKLKGDFIDYYPSYFVIFRKA